MIQGQENTSARPRVDEGTEPLRRAIHVAALDLGLYATLGVHDELILIGEDEVKAREAALAARLAKHALHDPYSLVNVQRRRWQPYDDLARQRHEPLDFRRAGRRHRRPRRAGHAGHRTGAYGRRPQHHRSPSMTAPLLRRTGVAFTCACRADKPFRIGLVAHAILRSPPHGMPAPDWIAPEHDCRRAKIQPS